MLTDDEVAELAALRARAFGPDADLGDDPAGLARLEQLEQRSRPDAAEPVTDTPPAPAARPETVGPVEPAQPAREASVAASPAGSAARVVGPASPPEVPAPASPVPEATVPAPAEPRRGRPTWTRRAVLLIGIPVVAVACAAAAALGANLNPAGAARTPSPNTTLSAVYVASLHSVSEMHTWDEGSPRLLGDIDRTLVWEGTTANGSVTCVVVDNVFQGPISTCQSTDALTTSGVGVSVADPRSEAVKTYVAWPNGAPMLTYTTDDPNPSP